MEAAKTVRRRRTTSPVTKAWNLAKDLDSSQKLQLVTMLISSVKPASDGKSKRKLDARNYAGIWSDDEYMDADELVDAIHNARHFKDRTKFWEEL